MSAIIAVFDDSKHLEDALGKLADSGVDADIVRVYDPPAREAVPGVGAAVLPGVAPAQGAPGVAAEYPGGYGPAAGGELQAALDDAGVSSEEQQFYLNIAGHQGKLVIVDAGDDDAASVTEIFKSSGATKVGRHD